MSSGKGHDGKNGPCRQAGGRLILLRDPAKAFADVVRAGGINEPCRAVLDLDVHRQIAGVDVIDGILVQRDLLHRVRIAVGQFRAQGAAALPGTAEVKKHPRDHQNNSGEQ